ncbi:tape measure protein [Microbacterium Phage DejaVu]|nr:tape measure protein [Microbacterium Phage DejaVu]
MADPVNVAFNVTEKGFDKILRDVGLLRSELEALGVDVSGPVQRALNGIETTSVKVGRSTRETANAYKTAAREARDLASATKSAADAEENLSAAQQRRRNQVTTERTTRTNQGQGGSDYRNASTSIDAIIVARQEQNRVFSNQIEERLRGEAREAEKTAQAVNRLTQASARRAKVEEDYYRNRYRQNNRNAMADFDAEFKALEELQRLNDNAADPSARYALYDVAAAYTAIGASLAGVAIYAGVVGADFQEAFSNVARTTEPLVATDEYLQNLRSSLVQLSGQIPLTFRELSEIATLGNQLGIADDAVEGFTSTVARFSSVSGLSADEVARAFGGIRAQTGLAEEYFENLGASMALVSVRSNATEAQIISLTREIAASASLSGFAIDQVVGLAGALASLQVAPERARGVLDTYFTKLNTAVREGGDNLEAFSRVTGLAGDEIESLVRRGEGLTVFQAVLRGLRDNSNDVVSLDANLEALGLTGLRASNTFQRFVNSLGVADKAFADANEGFMEGAELQRQYAITVENLSSQFTILISAFNGFIDAVSGGGVESLAGLLQMINNVIFALTEWIGDNRIVAGIIGFGIAVAGITGVLFLVRAGLTIATAATYAARTAIAQMGAAALASAGTLRGLIVSLAGVTGGMTRATAAATIFRRTLPGLIATGAAVGLSFLADQFFQVEDKAGDSALSMAEYNEIAEASKFASAGGASGAEDFADSLGEDGVAGAAEDAGIKVRTLVDYVNDLNGVFRRSEGIRFGSDAAFDEITLKWIELNEQVEKYRQEVRTLTAERGLKEYFLGIANAYDDQLRAAQLREEIAQIDDKLADAQAGASTELEGNSKAAIENRKVFRDLLGSYEDYVSALASAGASQEQIQAVISQLNTDFNTQASALGFNSGEIQTYGSRFNDLATIVAGVPRDVTVSFNGDPALQALQEFYDKAEEQARRAGQGIGDALNDGIGSGIGAGDPFAGLYDQQRKLPSQGRTTGDDWWNNFIEGVKARPFNLIPIVGPYITEFIEKGFPDGFEWGDRFVNGIIDLLNGRNPFEQTRSHRGEQAANDGRALGGRLGDGVAEGATARLGYDNSVNNWIANQNSSAYTNGRTVGGTIGGGIVDGLNSALLGRQVRTPFAKKEYSSGGYVAGFSSGGYTGPGHWLQPAGVVHAGEYVIPKKHVNQTTGLPDPSYVANLQRGRSAPKSGYATGGFVNGGNSGPIELGPVSLGAIMNGLSVKLNVGREQLARATSGGNSRLAFTGSN